MGSWVRTITTPFRKACTCTPINPPPDQKKPQPGFQSVHTEAAHERYGMTVLHGEVMACSYEDVKVMWSILDKSNSAEHRSSR
ncbi:uncharacterized protein LOC122035959 [Zingiber officinale]|uniref:uncharacterized protein LOC122035959 n=1 Tax=Zingiber officinale TaxID=94328 RepID=UPI001C4CFD49|nr:uncharacterized protein LOC122035959 [Zingiber officinale]